MIAASNVQAVFVGPDGTAHRVTAASGQSLMQAALDAGVPGIGGICGGDMCCATCVVRPARAWAARLPGPVDDERIVLQGMPSHHADDRLSCQIRLDAAVDGLVVTLP
jgi:2Fe-2S ferredoxin